MRVTWENNPQVGVYSFSTREGRMPNAQMEFDCSKLRDPQGQRQFSGYTGDGEQVRKWVAKDPRVDAIIQSCRMVAADLLTIQTGHSAARTDWVSFSFKDPQGKWISPAVAELVAEALSEDGWKVATEHARLEMGKR